MPGDHGQSVVPIDCCLLFSRYSPKWETSGHEPCCASRHRFPSGYLLLCFSVCSFVSVVSGAHLHNSIGCCVYRCRLAANPTAYNFSSSFHFLLIIAFSPIGRWKNCCARVARLHCGRWGRSTLPSEDEGEFPRWIPSRGPFPPEGRIPPEDEFPCEHEFRRRIPRQTNSSPKRNSEDKFPADKKPRPRRRLPSWRRVPPPGVLHFQSWQLKRPPAPGAVSVDSAP